MARFDVAGLLGKIGGLPNMIGQGLLGPQPVNPALGLDPSMVQQARQQSLQDLAMGLMAGGPGMSQGQTLMAATQNARQGFQGRVFDALKEQELLRLNQERVKRQAAEDAYAATLPEEIRPIAAVAGYDKVAQAQIGSAFAPPPDTLTDDIKEYRVAVQQGYQGTLQDWIMDQRRAGATNVSVNNNLPVNESKFLGAMGENASKQLDGLQTQADSAKRQLESTARLKPLTDNPDFIAGTLGDARLVVAKALGLPGAAETQTYFASVGDQVAERIKAFGAGTGLSDADREFAKQIAAGSIELTPDAIKRIVRINEESARAVLRLYDERRSFYSKKHPEVLDYYPEIKEQGGWSIKPKK